MCVLPPSKQETSSFRKKVQEVRRKKECDQWLTPRVLSVVHRPLVLSEPQHKSHFEGSDWQSEERPGGSTGFSLTEYDCDEAAKKKKKRLKPRWENPSTVMG